MTRALKTFLKILVRYFQLAVALLFGLTLTAVILILSGEATLNAHFAREIKIYIYMLLVLAAVLLLLNLIHSGTKFLDMHSSQSDDDNE